MAHPIASSPRLYHTWIEHAYTRLAGDLYAGRGHTPEHLPLTFALRCSILITSSTFRVSRFITCQCDFIQASALMSPYCTLVVSRCAGHLGLEELHEVVHSVICISPSVYSCCGLSVLYSSWPRFETFCACQACIGSQVNAQTKNALNMLYYASLAASQALSFMS